MVTLARPATVFSRARDRPGGPPRLRTDDKPLGLDGLRDVDAGKVRVGNTLMYFSCRILRLAMFWRIPFTLENPERSRLWLCPAVKSLLRRRGTSSVVVHFCAFGTSWKKPTRFFGVNVELDILQQYICKSFKAGAMCIQWQTACCFNGPDGNRRLAHESCRAIPPSFDAQACPGVSEH